MPDGRDYITKDFTQATIRDIEKKCKKLKGKMSYEGKEDMKEKLKAMDPEDRRKYLEMLRRKKSEASMKEDKEGEEYTDFAGLASVARKLGIAGAAAGAGVGLIALIKRKLAKMKNRKEALARLTPEERALIAGTSRGEHRKIQREEYYKKTSPGKAAARGAVRGAAGGMAMGGGAGAVGGAVGGGLAAYRRAKKAKR